MKKKISTIVAFLAFTGLLQAQELDTWLDSDSGIEFIKVPAGCIFIGTDKPKTSTLVGRPGIPEPDEAPKHEICVDSFWLGKFELTQKQWQKVMKPMSTEAIHPQRAQLNLTREDAEKFLSRLNKKAESDPAQYRLPTEAEWEYACRSGDSVEKVIDDYNVFISANMSKESWFKDSKTEKDRHVENVGQLNANSWGLYDMLGNAMELVKDDYQEHGYRLHSLKNPLIDEGGDRYVIRGGSYKSEWHQVRCGQRNFGVAGDRLPTVGMRVVKTITPDTVR